MNQTNSSWAHYNIFKSPASPTTFFFQFALLWKIKKEQDNQMSWSLSSFNWLVIVGFHGKKKTCASTSTESPLRLEDVIGFAHLVCWKFPAFFFFSFLRKKRKKRKKRGEKYYKANMRNSSALVRADSSLLGVQKQLFASGRTKAIGWEEVGRACVQT